MLRRYELTDEEWLRIEPLLPPENTGKQGRPRKDNRIIMNGIVWLARSGAPWRDLPERYGSWKTVYSRFRKWIDDGILDNIFRILSLEAELEELSIDASIIQAHQHSAGAKKGGLQMKSGIAVEEQAVLYTSEDNVDIYFQDYEHMNGKKVGLLRDSVMISIMQSLCSIKLK